jgi:uncharacterized membrane protein HdeD (DUF308 family)
MPTTLEIFTAEAPDILAVHWGWVIALGIGIGVLGILAIMRARIATTIAVGLLGVLLSVSGVAILLFAFITHGFWTEFFIHVLWAVLITLTGFVLITRPTIGAEAITVLIAFYFIAEGVTIIGFAFASHIGGLWFYIVQGLMALLLGCLLVVGWPLTGLWAIGTFIGIDLLFKSWLLISLGLGLRAISEGPLF